ncbi:MULTISPECIES: Ger(x)C family spore germination protein [unclassified Bacillus (in: firmicutes)]|uniref:Ger(x)C family spore germination protein n=1 Tax=unclassified Bacillus (in: firmicutes) TaxID=185979 RepID=UPI0008E28151|nr:MULTISPECIES: Ger(x)C family spore germination protein [unclassified Bacillus (in: firmicutes)]SFB12153.1 spore germination protein [Bacillus sp. UNCCL13]SFQ90323.1 spore germination protein [Bacillus sp. cl95]
MLTRYFMIVLLILLLLSGCVDREILDDINLERAVAYDYVGKNKVMGSAIIPVYLPDQSVKNVMYTATSTISRDFLRDMQRQSEQPLVTGSLEIALFGEKLANRGVIELVDSFQRDASIGSRLFLAVVDGKAKNILEGDYGESGKAIYISNLISHNIKDRDLPDTNLQLFLSDYYQKGKTVFLPRLGKFEKDKVTLTGISLFKDDAVVDNLVPDEMFFFKLMVDRYSEGHHKVKIKNDEAIIRSLKSKHKMKLNSPTEITMNIKIRGILLEYSGTKLTQKEINQIERNFEKKVNKHCAKLAKRFQEQEIDPVGFGHFAKTQTRGFDLKKWEANYKNVKFNFNTEVNITEAGTIE